MDILAIDIGGSGSRALLITGDTRHAFDGPGVEVGPSGVDAEVILEGLFLEGVPVSADVISIGMSGLMSLGSPDDIVASVLRRWPGSDVIVASDAVTSVAGAFGDRGGAIVAAGTGVVALGTDLASTWQRVDGWGHLLGDDGGGAWIGQRGLRAALRSHDGRPGGSTPLLGEAVRQFGDPALLVRIAYTSPVPARLLAGFSPSVARIASAGDAVALGICSEAGSLLAESALAALVPGVPGRVALVGGVAGADGILTATFRARVEESRPGVEVVVGASNPLEGSVALARMLLDRAVALRHNPPYLYITRKE